MFIGLDREHIISARGKEQNIAITSVARELSGFIWGVMNMAG